MVLLDGIFRSPLCYSLSKQELAFNWSHTRIWPRGPDFSDPEPAPSWLGVVLGPVLGLEPPLYKKT